MRTIRSHIDQPLAVGQRLHLPEDSSLHLLRVLRLGPGDAVTLFNGDGHDYAGRLDLRAKQVVEGEPAGLTETVAERIANATLEEHPLVEVVRVKVKKPNVRLGDTVLAGSAVQIVRRRP